MNELSIKALCLNVAGNRFAGVTNFLQKQTIVDVFCFQEVISTFVSPNYPESLHRTIPRHSARGALVNLPIISRLLDRYQKNFSPHQDFLESYAPEGNLMAVRYLSDFSNKIQSMEFGSIDIFSSRDYATNVILQWVLLGADSLSGYKKPDTEKRVIVTNVHGLWERTGKGDSELKLEQSRRIVKALNYLKQRFSAELVVMGDFNLSPDSESIAIIEQFGLRNLIKKFNITSTRSSIYTKQNRFADYVFVSSGVHVNDFRVLTDEVSDHLPLRVDFTV